MSKKFTLDFLDDRKIDIAIDLGKGNLKYICNHINSNCQLFTKEGSREFARQFNLDEKNKDKSIKLINMKFHLREFPKDYANLIVVKNIDFNTKEIFRVLKKDGLVIIYFPITKNFDEAPYLQKVQDYFKQVGFFDIYMYKNQDLDDGLYNVLVGIK